VQSAESPSVALSKVTRNHNESEARKKLPRQWSGQAQAPRKKPRQMLTFRPAGGAGIGVKILVLVCFAC